MAYEQPTEDYSKWHPSNESYEAQMEASQQPEVKSFGDKISELSNWINHTKEHHSETEQSSSASGENNREIRERLYAEATLDYFNAMNASDDVRETFDELREIVLEKLKGDEDALNWFYNTAEKELVKVALEELGFSVDYLSATDMRDFMVDFVAKRDAHKTYITVMHQVPVLEFPNNNIVFSDKTKDFGELIPDEDVDTGDIKNIHWRDQDTEKKKLKMSEDFSRISGAHHDLYAVKMSQGRWQESTPSNGIVITLPNLREAAVEGRKPKQQSPSDNLQVNMSFVDWNEMEPGPILRNSLKRALGDRPWAYAA